MQIIETQGLSRTFQTYRKPEGLWNSVKGFWSRDYVEKIALEPTDLSIEGGQIIGLVGSNGAGKTTLLKLLSGLIYPTSGTARVLGFDPSKRQSAYLKQMSLLLGQKNQLWWDLSAVDSYQLLARIYDLNLKDAALRVRELAQMLDCEHVLETQLRRLSLGERMKMEIIGSLLHRPRVLFLDEPTIGLDVMAQTSIREFLANYVKQEGPTVILTSHYMDDIAKLSDRLLLISHGRIVYDGTVKGFISKSDSPQIVTVQLQEPLAHKLQLNENVTLDPGSSLYTIKLESKQTGHALSMLTSHARIQELKIEESDFEDVIRRFLEKELGARKARGAQQSRIPH